MLYCFLHSERVFCVHSNSDGSELDNGTHGPPLGSVELLSLIAIVNPSLVKWRGGQEEKKKVRSGLENFKIPIYLFLPRLKPHVMLLLCLLS